MSNSTNIHTEAEVDIEVFARGGRTVPTAHSYRIRIDDEKYRVEDPVITGRQLLDEASKRPALEFLVFQVLRNGMLEEVRLDETVDLRRPGLERFISFKSDRSFRFVIDGRRFEWGAPQITGMTLKSLAGVDPNTYALWLEVRGEDDREVENGEFAHLEGQEVERFFTGKKTTSEG